MSHAKVVVTLTAVLMVVVTTSAQTPRQAVSTDTAALQEQSRWGDLNPRLEDLERTLAGR